MIETPDKYKRFLRKVGGLNDFGEPSFLLIWGENRTIEQLALPQPFLAPYLNCWVLAKWEPAEEFGPPSEWPGELGPYPSRGGYVPLAVFRDDKREPYRLESDGLNQQVLHLWVYTALKHEHDRLAERRRVFDEVNEKRENAKVQRIADLLQDAVPSFGLADGVSFQGQANCNSALRQKMEEVEQRIKYSRRILSQLPKRSSIYKPQMIV